MRMRFHARVLATKQLVELQLNTLAVIQLMLFICTMVLSRLADPPLGVAQILKQDNPQSPDDVR